MTLEEYTRTSICAHLNFLAHNENWDMRRSGRIKGFRLQSGDWDLKNCFFPTLVKFWPGTKKNLGINLNFAFLVIVKITCKFRGQNLLNSQILYTMPC